jgi:hypothetical protein
MQAAAIKSSNEPRKTRTVNNMVTVRADTESFWPSGKYRMIFHHCPSTLDFDLMM